MYNVQVNNALLFRARKDVSHMKKRLAAIVLALALLVSCAVGISSAASSYQQENIERELIELMEKYCGTHWYNSYNGAIQCKGFADLVFNELFGTGAPGPYSDSHYTLPYATSRSCACLGVLSPAECTPGALRSLLSQALPGDYVQCVRSSGTQHSMIVVETTDTGITFFDCNLKGSYLCACYTYSWDDVAKNITRGVSLYRHNGYVPSKEYRLYFDPAGGKCELAFKTVAVGSRYGTLPTPERKGYIFEGWFIREFNSTGTPTVYEVTENSTKTAYSSTYLVAHWKVDEGPCAYTGHQWAKVRTVAPTCVDDGYDLETCTVCGKSRKTGLVFPTGHNDQLIGAVPATNVEDGSETYQCSRCGRIYSKTLVCQLNRFTDLDHKSWYFPYVTTMVSGGLMNGTSENSFGPNATLTRAMLVTILYRMQGEPETAPSAFRDVKLSAWYANAVGWASEAGVVSGYPDKTFRPDAAVTREQAATILFRYCVILGRSNTSRNSLSAFSDKDKVSSYAVEPMEWASACGILSGFPDGTLRPKGNAVRVQIAKMLVTLLESTGPAEGVG